MLPGMSSPSTIVAIATAPGQAGVAVIRLSGPEAWLIATNLFSKPFETPNLAVHGWLRDPETQEAVDNVLLLPFKAPKSFTGEDVVELHCHGGLYLPQRIVQLCLDSGAVQAGPGEFTQRAFLNGKLDLTQAESIADLIHAEAKGLAQVATHNLKTSSLFKQIEAIKQHVIHTQATIVASVDYPDEVDEPDRTPLAEETRAMQVKVAGLLAASARNKMVREGFQLALLGLPNAGKSSLFNALLANERSIVTHIAGTTRDVVSEVLTVSGIPITLTDTAGIRDTHDTVEALGVERSWQTAQAAQALIYLVSAETLTAEGDLPDRDQPLLQQLPKTLPLLVVVSKADLAHSASKKRLQEQLTALGLQVTVLAVSAASGEGLEGIFSWLEEQVQENRGHDIQDRLISLNRRQTVCLKALEEQLAIAADSLAESSLPLDVVTVPLSEALAATQQLLGEDATEQMLDDVFSRFCVGK